MPSFHPDDDLLIEYAAGSLSEPTAVLVATHMALCPQCRERERMLEAVGSVLLEDLDDETVDPTLRASVLAMLDDFEVPAGAGAAAHRAVDLRVPEPLRSYLGGGLDELAWRSRGPVAEVRILAGHPSVTSRLFRIKAGTAMPRHTHDGTEFTLVLAGGFTDRGSHFLRGDVATAGSDDDHSPVADADGDCYCFAVHDAPLRLSGRLGKLLNPFIRI